MTKNKMLKAALWYADHGLAVLPLWPKAKNPLGKPEFAPHGVYSATLDKDVISEWWKKEPNANIGIAAGSLSGGLVVIDIDKHGEVDGYDTLLEFQREYGELPDTANTITGSGGYHFFFRSSEEIKTPSGAKSPVGVLPGIDIRGEGSFVVAPPSIHPNGSPYVWEQTISEFGIAEADRAVSKLVNMKGAIVSDTEITLEENSNFRAPDQIKDGERNYTLFRAACSMQAKGYSDGAILNAIRSENMEKCSPPLKDKEVQTIVKHALKYPKGEAIDFRNLKYEVPNTDKPGNEKKSVPLWVQANTIEPKEAHFLRAGIPSNNITAIGGDGGTGKGFLECNLTAAITKGCKSVLDEEIENVFDGKRYSPERVLLLNTEDSFAHIMRKRLTSAGADLSLVTTINPEGEESILLDRKLIEAVHQIKPALVILDPLQAFVPKGVAMERRNEMRQLLAPLQKCAEEMSIAFLIVMHTNKRMGAYGRARLADSADMWDIARSVFIMGNCNDDEKTRYISHEKSSYGEPIRTALCRIDSSGLYRVGSTDKKDYDFCHERDRHSGGRPSAKLDEAKALIVDILSQQEGWCADAKTINSIAKNNGIKEHTISRARKELQDEGTIEQYHIGSGADYKVMYRLVEFSLGGNKQNRKP